MKRSASLLAVACIVFAGCQALGGPDRLVAELQARGVSAARGPDQPPGLLEGDATTICVNHESVTVYEYAAPESAIDAAAMVDQDDPSVIGNAVVEWAGTPHFWLRDRVIVLYVGEDQSVEAALRDVLGRPFAEGDGPGRGVPGGRPPCERVR